LSGVLNATADEVATVEGMGENSAAFLQCVGSIIQACKSTLTREIPTYYQPENFLAYAKDTYTNLTEEVFDVYFMKDDTYIYLRRRFEGDTSSVTVTVKWLQKLLLECKPTGIAVIHNHPSGCAKPSEEDQLALEQCQKLCLNLDVLLCDFCICAEEGVYSYYQTGELAKIAKSIIAHNTRKIFRAEEHPVE
jgi:DNA repair protein RadC